MQNCDWEFLYNSRSYQLLSTIVIEKGTYFQKYDHKNSIMFSVNLYMLISTEKYTAKGASSSWSYSVLIQLVFH